MTLEKVLEVGLRAGIVFRLVIVVDEKDLMRTSANFYRILG